MSSNICRVYPVPATHILNIEMVGDMKTNLILTDAQGKLILDRKFDTNTSLLLDGLAQGTYYLTLRTEQGALSKQILIE